MNQLAKIRELIELEFAEHVPEGAPTDLQIAMVVMILDHHQLLRGFEGTPQEYRERVRHAWRESLDRVVRERGE